MVFFPRFGYIHATDFVGAENDCNNPFFNDPAVESTPKVGNDELREIVPPSTVYARSRFAWHAFAKSDSLIHDACVGPFRGEGSTPELSLSAYAAAAVDTSTNLERWPNYPDTGFEYGDEVNAFNRGTYAIE